MRNGLDHYHTFDVETDTFIQVVSAFSYDVNVAELAAKLQTDYPTTTAFKATIVKADIRGKITAG